MISTSSYDLAGIYSLANTLSTVRGSTFNANIDELWILVWRLQRLLKSRWPQVTEITVQLTRRWVFEIGRPSNGNSLDRFCARWVLTLRSSRAFCSLRKAACASTEAHSICSFSSVILVRCGMTQSCFSSRGVALSVQARYEKVDGCD